MEKSIAKNSIFNVMYKVMNIVFPLFMQVYISHILLATGVGKINIAQNRAQYFILLAPLGLLNYGTREIAKVRKDSKRKDQLFSELFILNFISTTIFILAYYLMVCVIQSYESERRLYLICGIPIILNYFNVEWYYQGMEEYVYISVRSIIIKALSLVLIFIFVRTESDYLVYAFIYTIGIAGNHFLNILNLIKNKVRLHFTNLCFFKHLKPVIILFSTTLAIELYTLLDTTMLGVFCNVEIVGYYTNAIKLDRIIIGLITSIGTVLLPRFSWCLKEGLWEDCNSLLSLVIMIIIFFSIPCGIGLLLIADKIIPILYGLSFMPAVKTVRIGTLLIYILGLNNLFGTQVLIAFNQEKKLLICTIFGALSNFIMNLFLIPQFQHNGAIIASVLSELFVLILLMFAVRRYISIKISKLFWIKTIISALVMGLFVEIVSIKISNLYLNIIISVLTGVVLYIGVNLVLKNPIVEVFRLKFSRGEKNV